MGSAPVLPPMGLTRRMNRLVAAIALLLALNVLALALAWTSGTASRSTAKDLDGQQTISEVKPQPKRAAEANPPTRVLAEQGNPDRPSRSIQAPQPAATDRLPDLSLRSPVREKVNGRDIPLAGERPSTASRAAISKRFLEQIMDQEASESLAPVNTAIGDDTLVGDIDTGGEVSVLEIDEAREQASDGAIDEATDEAVTATRSAAVITDVNMRAKPDNAAAVIMVVPGKSDVEVVGCDDWCEVVVAGKRGWIYHRFVGAADSGGALIQ